jgi:hypothetical protein
MWFNPISCLGRILAKKANMATCDKFHRQQGTSPNHGNQKRSKTKFMGSMHVASTPEERANERIAERYPVMIAGAAATAIHCRGTSKSRIRLAVDSSRRATPVPSNAEIILKRWDVADVSTV